jgi:hypothetical protein
MLEGKIHTSTSKKQMSVQPTIELGDASLAMRIDLPYKHDPRMGKRPWHR